MKLSHRVLLWLLVCALASPGAAAPSAANQASHAVTVVADSKDDVLAEDAKRGRCDNPKYDSGEPDTVAQCEKDDLEAGDCDYHGNIEELEKCVPTDFSEGGRFLQVLQGPSGGKISSLEDVHGVYADITVLISDEYEADQWLKHHLASTMKTALQKWSRVFHRNHRVHAEACVRVVDDSVTRSEVDSWHLSGFDYDGLTDTTGIIAEECERANSS